jgi:predicted RNase H-like HicB family nuclease
MRSFTAVIERCAETGLYVGYVPGIPGAHSQGETRAELHENLKEVISLLFEEASRLKSGLSARRPSRSRDHGQADGS